MALFLLLLLAIASVVTVTAQSPDQQLPPTPLGEALLMMLDSDKDQMVTLAELKSRLTELEAMFQEGGDEESKEYLQFLKGTQAMAPQLFTFLDDNRDGKLSASELKFVTKFEASLKKSGQFSSFIRDSFEISDTNGDDKLSQDEWLAAPSQLVAITGRFLLRDMQKKLFPNQLEDFLGQAIFWWAAGDDKKVSAPAMELFHFWDTDKDGFVQRKEAVVAYNIAAKKFMEISKTIKKMGPMLAMTMFSGADGGAAELLAKLDAINSMNVEF